MKTATLILIAGLTARLALAAEPPVQTADATNAPPVIKSITAKGRKALAETSGISPKLILKWVNHADLFRIKGIRGQYAELLEAGGVDTVAELAHRKAENLQVKLDQVNQEKNLVNRSPSLAEVTRWITEAKELPRNVTY